MINRPAAIDLLKAARAVIENPEHWTQHTLTRDKNGDPCNMEYAVCFCALGAVHKAVFDNSNPFSLVENTAVDALKDSIKGLPMRLNKHPIAFYNDNYKRTHAEVLTLFDETIARLENQDA